MTLSIFPDVNVWLALSHRMHIHHLAAQRWFDSLNDMRAYFCRVTQLSFLRLLTTERVMRDDVITQVQAWHVYLRLLSDERVGFHNEPASATLEQQFRRLSNRNTPSPKVWADAYLAAFAIAAGLTIVTFDRVFASIPGVDAIVLPTPGT